MHAMPPQPSLAQAPQTPAGRCPYCHYPINPGLCPECGRTTGAGSLLPLLAPRWTRRHTTLSLTASLLLAVSLAYNWTDPYTLCPTWLLLHAQLTRGSRASVELTRRLYEKKLKPDQQARFLRTQISHAIHVRSRIPVGAYIGMTPEISTWLKIPSDCGRIAIISVVIDGTVADTENLDSNDFVTFVRTPMTEPGTHEITIKSAATIACHGWGGQFNFTDTAKVTVEAVSPYQFIRTDSRDISADQGLDPITVTRWNRDATGASFQINLDSTANQAIGRLEWRRESETAYHTNDIEPQFVVLTQQNPSAREHINAMFRPDEHFEIRVTSSPWDALLLPDFKDYADFSTEMDVAPFVPVTRPGYKIRGHRR